MEKKKFTSCQRGKNHQCQRYMRVQDLNEHFGTLGVDDHYVEHVSVDVKGRYFCDVNVIYTQVLNTLSKIKKTAT